MTVTADPDLTARIVEHVLATEAATGVRPGSRAIAAQFHITRHKVRSLNIPAALAQAEAARTNGHTRTRRTHRPLPTAPRTGRIPTRHPPRPLAGRLSTHGRTPRPHAAHWMPRATSSAPAGRVVSRSAPRWPLLLMGAPAFVAIWGGWVELGRMAGFGPVQLLPGLANVTIDLAITLPVGLEVYAAYALMIWLGNYATTRLARRFAAISAITSLLIGSAGQTAYHLLDAAEIDVAPWPITAAVAVLPVAVVGMAATLAHLIHTPRPT